MKIMNHRGTEITGRKRQKELKPQRHKEHKGLRKENKNFVSLWLVSLLSVFSVPLWLTL
jgi:hypothetical protein